MEVWRLPDAQLIILKVVHHKIILGALVESEEFMCQFQISGFVELQVLCKDFILVGVSCGDG